MNKIKITQKKSSIGCNFKHKIMLKFIGLKGINKSVIKPDNPSVMGILKLINYIIKYEKY